MILRYMAHLESVSYSSSQVEIIAYTWPPIRSLPLHREFRKILVEFQRGLSGEQLAQLVSSNTPYELALRLAAVRLQVVEYERPPLWFTPADGVRCGRPGSRAGGDRRKREALSPTCSITILASRRRHSPRGCR